MEHTTIITKVSNPKYPFTVSCSCQYNAHAKTQEQADYYKRWHEHHSLMLKATKGMPVGR
jgi:hypothetical protein